MLTLSGLAVVRAVFRSREVVLVASAASVLEGHALAPRVVVAVLRLRLVARPGVDLHEAEF